MTNSLTVFLIDDDEDDISLFHEMLQEVASDARFSSAVNGLEALETLRSSAGSLPQLIFLDLNMPRMNGKECLTELKQDPQLQAIPVIIYSTSSSAHDRAEVTSLGALGMITKPFSLLHLKQMLELIVPATPDRLEQALERIERL